MRIYTTIQGDMLDMVCHREYGDESGFVKRVYDANPGLAELGLIFDIGTEIILPDLNNPVDLPQESIWG